jgi:enediyne biosynthesis protein E4
LDLFVVQGQMLGSTPIDRARFPPPDASTLRGRLFRNDLQAAADGRRTLHFTDVTETSGIAARGYGMGVATGDFDNDGIDDPKAG